MAATTSSSDQPFAVTPVLTLYRDALHSVFQWSSIRELHAVRAVCSNWRTAVDSMPSLRTDVVCSEESLSAAVHSSLARHIGCFVETQTARERRNGVASVPVVGVDLTVLSVLHHRAPNLHTLSWSFETTTDGCQWPAQLTDLQLEFVHSSSEQINSAIATLSKLSILQRLSMGFLRSEDVALDSLASLPRLSNLAFTNTNGVEQVRWSDAQLEAIRACRSLVMLEMPWSGFNTLTRLLERRSDEAPELFPLLTALKGYLVVPNHAGAVALRNVPNLIELSCTFLGNTLDLTSHPRIRTLNLAVSLSQLTLAAVVAAIVQCRALTSLSIQSGGLASANVASIMRQCSGIHTLKLISCSRVDSLNFLSLPRLATDLVDLEVLDCGISEECIVELLSLTALRRLRLALHTPDRMDSFHQNLRTLRAKLPGVWLECDIDDNAAQKDIDAILAEE